MGDTPEMISAIWLALTSGVQVSCNVVDRRSHPAIYESAEITPYIEPEGTYPRQSDVPQGHLGTVKVEEVHELHRLALA